MNAQTGSGNVLEQTVKGTFQAKKFKVVQYRDWKKSPEKYGAELLLLRAPYETIYKHKGVTEFLLKSKKYNKDIRIECKWQQVSGSVDEKLPYLYLNVISCPEKEIAIIIDGDGWKKGAIEWLRNAIAEKMYSTHDSDKIVRVFNLKEFVTWANKEFKE